MSEQTFGKVITAMVTPFDQQGNVNYEMAEKLAVHLVNNGSDSLLVSGTTGESPTLSWSEKCQLFKVVKKAVGNKAKVLAGTGGNSTQHAIEMTQEVAKMGLDGSLQVVPYYNKPPQEGLYEHFKKIAETVGNFPIMLYNIPGRTGTNMSPETTAKLAKIDNIVAIKEASGNLEQACKIRRMTDSSFLIYAGDDFLTLPLLTVGGVGVVSVASHLVGLQMQEMIAAYNQQQGSQASQINVKLFPLFKVLFCTSNPLPIKAALNLQGWDVGGVRLPLVSISEKLKQEVKLVLEELSLL
ncbi:4-hydroxy-tetrahydrodipicolinate synthase [Crocosphaera watsonii WH 8501]|uniref:4-hydroxy-tetrahydrodipicolinate synthase n=6 Tax=Crocosphaera watsonii TaxID=263511 RepID=Q4C2C6_CROWT|nr:MULTISPECIES: 4-hydroxy-tetrahydrodipicolinate synthase [Crocosphaera]EAM50307.1 Dihydrodipicolinate synthase subfamily [Crocosphaera watsonii WH 8501]EHJ12183.1 Dihydrodipicolinate synthase [Crocosphaera watsonii WH 0003]MCH2245376.1 4-hydroxy-tetrahydrodipicolinate synthase [Crocosphaera sp.]NQZ65317.1 4-hydroxy-tetrahydrodipicolinate synthase [Crocosphaera sp.]CCQ50346.1 Dihydrodipicolinate synthase [Crocosphaera watsonii WH 8502]